MRKLLLVSLLALLAAPVEAAPIGAGQVACFEFTSGTGQPTGACAPIDPLKGAFSYRLEQPFGDSGPDGFRVDLLYFTGNVDPSLSYALGVVDFGAPSTFSFSFATPVASDSYTHGKGTVAGLLEDPAGSSVSAQPVAPALRMQSSRAGNPSPLVNLGIDVGPPCSGVGLVDCGTDATEVFFAPTVYDFMFVQMSFVMSGGGDNAAFTGTLVLDKQTPPPPPVPEPSILLLLGTGIAAAFARRRSA